MNKLLWRCALKGKLFGSILDAEYIEASTPIEAARLYKTHYNPVFNQIYVCEVGWFKAKYEFHIIPSEEGMKLVKVKTGFRVWSF